MVKWKISVIAVLLVLASCNTNKVIVQDYSNIKVGLKPKNVILIIGDGMGLSQISYGMYRNGGTTQLERMQYSGLIKTHCKDRLITDSAAGGSAFSTGKKTKYKSVAVDKKGSPNPTILEQAEAKGLKTGMVATANITHATPASFIAHNISRVNQEAIALDFLKTDIDFVYGGGRKNFIQREDQLNLFDSLNAKGYHLMNEIELPMPSKDEKCYILTHDDHPEGMHQERSSEYLNQGALLLIDRLENENGYFGMIEASQIDWAGHSNDSTWLMQEQNDFDYMLGQVLDSINNETLVIVVADHETGGLALTHMDGDQIGAKFSTKGHSATMIPVFAYGPGAENFTGIFDNTAIYHKIHALLEL